MTTIITRTIGATGRDYASFLTAEADVENIATSAIGGTDLVSNDGAIVFEADAGTYLATLEFQSTLTADATRNVTYKAAAGSEHGGVVGTGVVLQGTNPAMTVRDAWIVFDGLEINITESGNRQVVSLRGEGMRGTVYRNCILWGGSLTDTVTERIWANTGADTYTLTAGEEVILENNKLWCSRRTISLVGGTGQDARFKVLNNTLMGRGPNDTTTPALLRTAGVVDGTWVIDVYNNLVKDDLSNLTSTGDAVTVNASDNVAAAAGSSPTSALAGSQTWTFNTDTTASSTGSQAIWDASTGELVNVSGNDAIGVGIASEAPTTDINGEDRIRDTHADPGAFTTQLRTITKSIDAAGGGDYTTFIAAEAATTAIGRSADLVKENTAIVFEADAGTYSETFIIDSQSAGLVTDATRNVTYTYASGAYHGGSSGAGVKISGTASVIKVKDAHTVLDGLEVVGTASNSGSVIWAEGYGYNGSQYRNLLVWSGASLSDSTGGNFAAIRQNNPIASYTPTTPMVIENTVFNSTNFGITVRSSASDNGFDVVIRNCTTTDSVRFLTDGGDGSVPTGGASKSVALHNNLDNSTGGLLVGANTGVTGTATNVFNDSTLPSALRAGNQNPSNLWQFTTNTAASSTGDQVIYTSSTGAMVNASGNDAIGVGDASSAPTTDIQGLNRIRATHVDPGAFTTDLLTATKTIGATGRDYTTFILAEGDINAIGTSALGGAAADLVANNGAIVFEADAGTYADTIFDSGAATDARDPIRTVTFKAAPGSESNGIIGTGVTIECSTSSGQRRSDPYLIFDSIDIRLAVVINAYGPNFYGDNILVKNCVIDWQGSQRDGTILNGSGLEFENCVIRGNSTFAGRRTIAMGTSDGTAVTCEFRNCTLEHTNNNVVFGLNGVTGHEVTLKNCIIRGTGVSTNYTDITFFGPANNVAPFGLDTSSQAGGQTWTFTTDDTASSTGSQVVYDDNTGQLYDVSGNDAWHYLTDLTNAPAIAIDGLTRDASGFNPGAFEESAGGSLPSQVTTGTPVSGSINVPLDQDLSWASATGASGYDVYFGVGTPSSLVSEDQVGLTYDPGTLAEDTTYAWRVDSKNVGGTTTGVEFTFTTLPPFPDQVTTGTPVSGSINVPLDQDLSWSSATGASGYDVYFGVGTPSSLVSADQVGLTYDPGTLAEDTTYAWRVDSKNVAGTTSGVEFTFTTLPPLPDAVTTGTPVSGAVDVPLDQDLSWASATNADTYNVYFGTSTSPSLAVSAQAGLSYDPGTLSPTTTYYWRVDTQNEAGVTTGTEFTFTTANLPSAVTTGTPVSGAINVSLDQDVSWSSATNADTYNVYFGTSTSPSLAVSAQAGLSYDPGTLAEDTTYYWRVDTQNAQGITTGTELTFTTVPAPPAQITTGTPTNGAVGVSRTQNISWDPAARAASYNIYFGTTTNPPLVSSKTGTSYNPGLLDSNTVYYWRVDSVNTGGVTTGIEFSFTTVIVVGPVVVGTPASGAVDVPLNQELSWSATENATKYNVYFGTTANPPLRYLNSEETTFDPGPLEFGKEYYWRVDARNGGVIAPGTSFEFNTSNFEYDPSAFIVAHDLSAISYEDASTIHTFVENYHAQTLPARPQLANKFWMAPQEVYEYLGPTQGPSVSPDMFASGVEYLSGQPSVPQNASAIVYPGFNIEKTTVQTGATNIVVNRWKITTSGLQFFFNNLSDFERYLEFTKKRWKLTEPAEITPNGEEFEYLVDRDWQTGYRGMILPEPVEEDSEGLSITIVPAWDEDNEFNIAALQSAVLDFAEVFNNYGEIKTRGYHSAYKFTPIMWRHGTDSNDPDFYTQNQNGIRQFRLDTADTNCRTNGVWYHWDSRNGPWPNCFSDKNIEIISNDQFDGSGFDLFISDQTLYAGGNKYIINKSNTGWVEDPFTGYPVEDGTRKYPFPGKFVLNNLTLSGVEGQNGVTTSSVDTLLRAYSLPDTDVFNCDFGREWRNHALYFGSNGNFYCQGSTFNDIGGQGPQLVYRAGRGNGPPYKSFDGESKNNTRYQKAHSYTVKDCHFHNCGNPLVRYTNPIAGEAPGPGAAKDFGFLGFAVTYTGSPGTSQFPGSVYIQDNSFVSNWPDFAMPEDTPTDFGKAGRCIVVGRPQRSKLSDPYYDIYSMPVREVQTENELTGLEPEDQETVKVLGTGDIWFWPKGSFYDQALQGGTTTWIKWPESDEGYPVSIIRISNNLFHSAPTFDKCMSLNISKEIILEHNTFSYDGRNDYIVDPERFGNAVVTQTYIIDIDTGKGDDVVDYLGNRFETSSIRISNNVGIGYNGGSTKVQIGAAIGSSKTTVLGYTIGEENNLGRTVIVNKKKFPYASGQSLNELRDSIEDAMNSGVITEPGQQDRAGEVYESGEYTSNQTWSNDFFIDRPYDVNLDGPLPTSSTGSGPRRDAPSLESPPSPATGPFPEDNATGVYTDVTILSWNANGAVDDYRVFLGTDQNNLFLKTVDPITDNFYDPGTLDENTQYFWVVESNNEYGTTSSNVFTFTTNGPAPPAPGPPVNISPEVGSVDVSTSPYLIWQAPEVTLNQGAASGYDVFFDTSDNWIPSNPPRIAQDVTTTIVGPVTNEGSPLEYSTEYTWRVDAKNISGETSSGEWTFTTEDAPLPPGTITVFIPEANATGVDIGQTLSWEAPTSGGPIDDYRVYFATDAEWAGAASLVATVPGNITSWTPSEDLEYNTVYRWSVITRGPGGSGIAPGSRIFTTQPFPDPPGEVTDKSPSANEVDVSIYQSLSWEAPTSGGPLVDYSLYFDTDADWNPGQEPGETNPVILPSNTTSWQPPTMDLSTVYRWAVVSRGPEENANPGSTIFTTEDGIDPPGTPSGLTPSANATGVAANQTLSWEVATPGGPITEYDVYLGTSATGPSLVSTQQTLVYTPEEDFEYLGVYVWKIVAKGPGGQAETALSYFTVEAEPEPPIDPPGSVTQGAPNNQSDIPINGTSLVWTAAPDAEVYEVFFDASSPANTSLSSNITGTIAGVRDLSSNTTYYWRVDASNTAGVTTGTEFSFSTVIILNPPDAVTEGSPNNVTNVSIDPTLSWGAAQGALSYKIYLDEGSANPETLIGTTTGNTSLPVPNSLVNDTSYSWRVDAENSDGTTTGTVFTFSTIELNPPGQVTTGIPNGVLGYTINPTLSWEVPSTGGPITSYNVYLGVSGEALNLLGFNNETSFSILGLNYSTDYIWRVDALGPDGTTPGTEFSFTTIDPPTNDPPNQVVNLNPLNNSEDVSVNPVLVWSDVQNITGYDVYFGATPSPSLVSENQQENFFIPEEAVAYDETFYWRVDSRNSAGTTEGVTWSFTTESSIAPPPPPPPPTRPSPVSENRNYEKRESDIREKIFKMTQAKQNISFVYRDSLRAMISSFNDLGYISVEDEYKEIKCLHANAERAIAKLKEEENIVLPIVTISQTTTANDDSRRRQESILINEKVWDKEKNRAFRVLSLAPRAVNISYQINIWCKYMADMDQVLEQIRLKFNPEMNVSTQASTLAKAYLDTEEDIGSVTAGDKEDRIIKKTFNVVFRTYVPNPKFLVTSTGKIEEYKTETEFL